MQLHIASNPTSLRHWSLLMLNYRLKIFNFSDIRERELPSARHKRAIFVWPFFKPIFGANNRPGELANPRKKKKNDLEEKKNERRIRRYETLGLRSPRSESEKGIKHRRKEIKVRIKFRTGSRSVCTVRSSTLSAAAAAVVFGVSRGRNRKHTCREYARAHNHMYA